MTTTAIKATREGSAQKRALILAAARELFLADGFERTSMDAIASRAGVSKRTVYDYYGDKRTLLLEVVQHAIAALSAAVDRAIADNLVDVTDVAEALIGFARAITTSAMGSADYSALMRLLRTESAHLPELQDEQWVGLQPEDAVAERFTELDRRGLLATPRPRLAADHFVALTLSPAFYTVGRQVALSEADSESAIVDGVSAFLRAYGANTVS